MSSPSHEPSATLPGEDIIRRRVKAELRKRMRALRKTTPLQACEERSLRIVTHLEAHPALREARTVGLYWPMVERHEVDLRALDTSLRARGVRLAYPAVDVNDESELIFRVVSLPSSMSEQGHMFLEPLPSDPLVGDVERDLRTLDVLIVPAIAIDPSGHRIGYGAGYYDRLLARLSRAQVVIGVAYDFQLIAEVPIMDGDMPVRWIVTDHRVLEAAPRE